MVDCRCSSHRVIHLVESLWTKPWKKQLIKTPRDARWTKGFSLNKGALSRYYLTAEHRANALRQLIGLISFQSPGLGHADLQSSRIIRDETDVESIVKLLKSN